MKDFNSPHLDIIPNCPLLQYYNFSSAFQERLVSTLKMLGMGKGAECGK